MNEQRLHVAAEISAAILTEMLGEYGVEVSDFQLLSGGLINTNVKVMPKSGQSIVSRIYIPERSFDEVSFEMSVLKRLADRGLPVQTPHVNRMGGMVGTYKGRQFVVLTFIEGVTMKEDQLSEKIARSMGRFVAEMHRDAEFMGWD